MPDNITRDTFDPTKGYTSVRMQQGRLQLDSDWNEQADIQNYLRRAQVVDMIGAGSGASKVDPLNGEFSEQSFQLRKIATPLLAYDLDTFNLRLASLESTDELPTEKDDYKKLIYIAKIQDDYYIRIFDQDGKLVIPNPELITNEELRQELNKALESEDLSPITQRKLIDKIFPPEATDIAILPGHFYAQGVLCELVPSSSFGVKRVPDKSNQLQVSPSLTIDGRRLKVGDWLIFADQSLKTTKLSTSNTTDTTDKPKENQETGETQASGETQDLGETQATGETQDSPADEQSAEIENSGTNNPQNTNAPDEPTPPKSTISALPGWRITRIVDASNFIIEVAGTLSLIEENAQMRRIVTYTSQPDWPVEFPSNSANPISQEQGRYFAYLDVWQRHITAVDDPSIREVALNGPDTTTRTKTVWQLKLRSAKDQNGQDLPDNGFKVPVATGEELPPKWRTFESEERQRSPKLNACARLCENGNGVTSNGRLGNFLYRVEIHTGNDSQAVSNNQSQATENPNQQQTVTFKWSRDNASVTSSVKSIDGNVIRIAKSSQNAWADSQQNQWLELLTEAQELRGEPGILVPLKSAIDNKLEFNPARIIGGAIPKNVSKVRRWDHTETDAPQGAIPIRDQWIELENGIKVQFEVPPKTPSTVTNANGNGNSNDSNQSAANATNGGTANNADTIEPQPKIIYRTGDYWLIPSRAVINDIEWPTDRADDDVSNQVKSVSKPLPQPRRGVEHRYALLGIVDVDNENRINQIFDQRILFPPLLRALDKGGDTISGDLGIRGQFSVTGIEENGQQDNNFPRFVVLENGHVGISTDQPQHELEVSGKIQTIDLAVTNEFVAEVFPGETFEIWSNPTQEDRVFYGKIRASQTDDEQPTDPKKIEFVAEPETGFSFLSSDGGIANVPLVDINGAAKLQTGVAINEFSTDGTLQDNSDNAVPTEKAVKTYIDGQLDSKANLNGDINEDFSAKKLACKAFDLNGYLINSIDNDGTLSNAQDDILPSQLAVKTYVDGQLDSKANLNGDISEDFDANTLTCNVFTLGNFSINEISSNSALANNRDNVLPTQKAVKSYIDNQLLLKANANGDLTKNFSANTSICNALTLSSYRINKISADGSLGENRDDVLPSQQAVKSYVDAQVGNLNSQLSLKAATHGDPTKNFSADTSICDALTLKSYRINEISADGSLRENRDDVLPSQQAVKSYVDGQVGSLNRAIAGKAADGGNSNTDFSAKDLRANTIFATNLASKNIDGDEVLVKKSLTSSTFFQLSSVALKDDVTELSGSEVAEVLAKLHPVKFKYKDDDDSGLCAGFLAEEVPDLLTTADHQKVKLMDVVAILTRAVQDNRKMLKHLSSKIIEKDEEILKLRRALLQQKAQIEELQNSESQSEGE